MTDEELAAIRTDAERWLQPEIGSYLLKEHIFTLLAEVERLRAREAATREIVEAVARGATTYRDREDEYCTQDDNCMWRSPGPGKPFQMVHTDRCIVTKARTLLGVETE